jgi:hypothetical protein
MHRIGRTLRHLVNQDTARSNAAEASATLRKRRHEHKVVDAYLQARERTYPTGAHAARNLGSPIAAHRSPPERGHPVTGPALNPPGSERDGSSG